MENTIDNYVSNNYKLPPGRYIYIYIYVIAFFWHYIIPKRVCVDDEHGQFVVERKEFIVNEF